MDKHVPTKDVVNRSRPCSPWFNHLCQATMRATRCLERRYRRIHTADDYLLWRALHDRQRQVFQAEYDTYWLSAIDMCPDSRSLWNRMNSLLRPVASISITHTADDFSEFFTAKVDTIRTTTATAPAPMIEHRQVPPLASFNNVTLEKVSQILRKSPNKPCELDPMPTWLVKELCDVIATIITSMANASFTQRLFPDSHKHAVVRPRIKKPSLDPLDIKSYRPISNLSLVSKTVERLIVNRMNVHVNQYGLFPARQSAYRQHHSTETAGTIVHNDIVRSTTPAFCLPWCCWISAQHSTPLITA